MDIEQHKPSKIIFTIVTIFITGITVGMLRFSIVPLFIQNYSMMETGLKSIIYMVFFLYFLENILLLSGTYLMIKHNKTNYFLLIVVLFFSITISVNGLYFSFLPYRLDITLHFNSGNSIVGVGINFLGIIFLVWWSMLYKKDNIIRKLNMDDLYKNYLLELDKLRSQISDLGYVQIKGEGKGSSIYASTDTRAIELSKADDGIWVWFWDRSNESSQYDKTFPNYELAVKEVRDWLSIK